MSNYKACSKCIMDTSDSNIYFNQAGECHYCVNPWNPKPITAEQEEQNLSALAAKIKAAAKGKYDCIVGVSGGVDSSYVVHLAKRMNLRTLILHCDNGWNSEIAIRNIHNLVDKTGFDYEAYVIDWREFKDLQRAFFKASVLDIELLTDHAIIASLYKTANKHNIKHMLIGTNYATERTPPAWVWRKTDKANILGIHKTFGSKKLKSFPMMGPFKKAWYDNTPFGPKGISILNSVNYRKDEVVEFLKREYGWQDYGGKHHESIFTKFYQAYYLPHKFGIDKRLCHYSVLIRNGELTRQQALDKVAAPVYSEQELQRDFKYVAEKLDFTVEEFEQIIAAPIVPHAHYGTDENLHKKLKKFFS